MKTLEIVHAKNGKEYFAGYNSKNPSDIERQFIRLHILGESSFYCILTCDLVNGPLTAYQKHLLDQAKTEGNLLDYWVGEEASL